ncbi:response regulator [Ensifer sp. ENS07]|uniref:response regulator n=1 Tax=Ensifer sp. ENS07 TaxID=2769274 RepID=UPI001780AA8F|nr:response regulator [Ensifer sp. ENS07]MBD9638459.1 response regulator [Ensifer sp. ENS07]
MRALIVEDDSFKAHSVCDVVRKTFPSAVFTAATSVHAAVGKLQEMAFDLIMLDMALPSHQLRPGFGPTSSLLSGGLEVIMELSYLRRSDPVIVLTQFPEIEIEGNLVNLRKAKEILIENYDANIVSVIHYRHEHPEWRISLQEEMKKIQ